jgi:hypothetical protein
MTFNIFLCCFSARSMNERLTWIMIFIKWIDDVWIWSNSRQLLTQFSNQRKQWIRWKQLEEATHNFLFIQINIFSFIFGTQEVCTFFLKNFLNFWKVIFIFWIKELKRYPLAVPLFKCLKYFSQIALKSPITDKSVVVSHTHTPRASWEMKK